MYIKNKRGQSTVEYVLLVTAVVAVMIAFVTSSKSGLREQLGNALNTAGNDVSGIASGLPDSHTQTNAFNSAPPSKYSVTVTGGTGAAGTGSITGERGS